MAERVCKKSCFVCAIVFAILCQALVLYYWQGNLSVKPVYKNYWKVGQHTATHHSGHNTNVKVINTTSYRRWRLDNNTVNFDLVTSANHTTVKVVNPKPVYRVGDILYLQITARDGNNRRKTYGGDYFQAVLRDSKINGSTAGRISDHGNGVYTVRFVLSFAGNVTPEVHLVHPSETVQLLQEVRQVPNKRGWNCDFQTGRHKAKKFCTFLVNQHLPLFDQCDFSAPNTSRTWFCEKPANIPCESITTCESAPFNEMVFALVSADQQKLFKRPFWVEKLSCKNVVAVVKPNNDGNGTFRLPPCGPGMPQSQSEGYWKKGSWHSLVCRTKEFGVQDMMKCLSNRTVHFMGDSTIRQWSERLVELKIVEEGERDIPRRQYTNYNRLRGIKTTFKFHTVPRHGSKGLFTNLSESGVSVEMKRIIGGPRVVIIISVCAHFTPYPIHVYRLRIAEIKSAINELHKRHPGTQVIIKTCNTRSHVNVQSLVILSDWLADQLNQEMRSIMGNATVAILDVWDLTMSMWIPHILHPPQHVIDNEMSLLMSYICPNEV